jgi:hypothetical protein
LAHSRLWGFVMRRSAFRSSLSLSLCLLLIGSVVGVVPVALAEELPAAVVEDASGVLVAPDAEVAVEAAEVSGEKVLVADTVSATEEVFARPDGRFEAFVTSAPTRVEDPSSPSGWSDLDLGLVARDGGFGPKVALSPVVFSAGGSGPFARVSGEGWSVGYTWPTPLPAPVIQGASATYLSVLPGVDLVVSALPSGFSKRLVVHERPKAPLAMRIGLALEGVRVVEPAAGLFEALLADGRVATRFSSAWMWDGSGRPDDPGRARAGVVDARLDSDGTGIVLSPEAAFLHDPTTVYPVTIDPAVVQTENLDTRVVQRISDNQWAGTSFWTDPLLQVGRTPSNLTNTRSFLNWFGNPLTADPRFAQIDDAHIRLLNNDSGSCTASQMQVKRLTSPISANTTWNSRPSWNSLAYAKASFAYGYSASCPANWVTLSGGGDSAQTIRLLVAQWMDDLYGSHGVLLHATDSTAPTHYKAFRSYDFYSGYQPYLWVLYSRPAGPAITQTPSPTPGTYTFTVGTDTGYTNYGVYFDTSPTGTASTLPPLGLRDSNCRPGLTVGALTCPVGVGTVTVSPAIGNGPYTVTVSSLPAGPVYLHARGRVGSTKHWTYESTLLVNRPPSSPAGLTPGTPTPEHPIVATQTPALRAQYCDPEGNPGVIAYYVETGAGVSATAGTVPATGCGTVTWTSAAISPVASTTGTYRWRATAIDSVSGSSASSAWTYFTVDPAWVGVEGDLSRGASAFQTLVGTTDEDGTCAVASDAFGTTDTQVSAREWAFNPTTCTTQYSIGTDFDTAEELASDNGTYQVFAAPQEIVDTYTVNNRPGPEIAYGGKAKFWYHDPCPSPCLEVNRIIILAAWSTRDGCVVRGKYRVKEYWRTFTGWQREVDGVAGHSFHYPPNSTCADYYRVADHAQYRNALFPACVASGTVANTRIGKGDRRVALRGRVGGSVGVELYFKKWNTAGGFTVPLGCASLLGSDWGRARTAPW